MLARKLQMAAAGVGGEIEADYNKVAALYHFNGSDSQTNAGFAKTSGYNSLTFTTGGGDPYQSEASPFARPEGYWSVYFDGSDCIEMPANTGYNVLGNGTFCCEYWVYVNSYHASYSDQAGVFNGTSSGWLIYQNGANLDVYINGSTVISTTRPAERKWHHIALTRDGTTLRLFVNGALAGSSTASLGSDQSVTLKVGGDVANSRNGLDGYISNFHLNRGLSKYTSAFTPPTAPLSAQWGTESLVCKSNMFRDHTTYYTTTITLRGTPKVETFSPHNSSTVYNPATHGGSVDFDGSDFIYTSAVSLTMSSRFTIDLWFYPRDSGSYSAIIGNSHSAYYTSQIAYNVHMLSGTLYWGRSTGYSYYDTAIGTPYLNAWNHLAICRRYQSPTKDAAWLNGVRTLDATANSIGSPGYLVLGRFYYDYNAYHFNGKLANLRLMEGRCDHFDGSGNAPATITIPTALSTDISSSGNYRTNLLMNYETLNLKDSTGRQDTLAAGNTKLGTGVGKYGTAACYFDGSGDALKLKDIPPLSDFTIEFWMRPAALPTWGSLLSSLHYYSSGWTNNWIFRIQGNSNLGFAFFSNGQSGQTSKSWAVPTMSTNTWYHVALCRSGSDIRCFLNGTESSSGSLTLSTALTDHSPQGTGGTHASFVVGQGTSNTDYQGYIDELRISTEALYTANFTPPSDAYPNS